MPTFKVYKLVKHFWVRLQNQGGANCRKCGKEIKEGERILSKNAGRHNTSKNYYHVRCAKLVNLL